MLISKYYCVTNRVALFVNNHKNKTASQRALIRIQSVKIPLKLLAYKIVRIQQNIRKINPCIVYMHVRALSICNDQIHFGIYTQVHVANILFVCSLLICLSALGFKEVWFFFALPFLSFI